jgi:hypothetical protein
MDSRKTTKIISAKNPQDAVEKSIKHRKNFSP